jgi:hypothetical protein
MYIAITNWSVAEIKNTNKNNYKFVNELRRLL